MLLLGYSRRQVIRVFWHEKQLQWFQALEEAFRSGEPGVQPPCRQGLLRVVDSNWYS